MKGKVLSFPITVLGMLAIFSLAITISQDQQNFRFRIGRLILDFSDNGSANVNIDDYGLGYVLFNEYSRGSSGQISFSLPFGQGKGIFSIGAFVDGWDASEGFASIDAFMTTIFRFVFNAPENIPPDTSLPNSVGFILFLEGWANAWGHGPLPSDYPGYASASGNFTTELISASAYINTIFPNPPYMPFDVYDHDPEQGGYKRDATIKTVDITSGQGEYVVKFSGSAATINFNAMSVGTAYARAGVVVLSGVDPLGIPEVGDNEFVWSEGETPWLWIPALARVVTGFTPDNHTMQWLAEKIDWNVSPSLPSTGLYVRMYPNGYENTFIFPRNRFEDANYEEPHFRYFLIFDMPEFLPATIGGGFGKRQLIMTFNGQPVHVANIEIFFPATATNHPFFGDEGSGNPPDEGWQFIGNTAVFVIRSPNWFYYYYWMAASFNDFRIRYANSDYSFYYDGDQYVHIGNDVINGHILAADGIRRWETYIPDQPYSETCHITAYQVYGIDAYARAVAHELEHKRIYDDYHALIEQAAQDGVTLDDPNDDYDGDGLPNFVEEQIGTDPRPRSTVGLFDDDELLANLAEHNVFGDKDKDWSDRGLNKGGPRLRVLTRVVR